MKDMKNRIIALILVVVMSLLALCSCGSYDFADEDITYASFDYAAFKDALAKIEIEDGEFTTDEATRLKIAAAKVYNAVVDKMIAETKEEDRNTTMSGDAALTGGDVLYFVYYATLGEQVFFGSQMNVTTLTSSSDKANHVVRLDNHYDEKTNTFAYLIQQEVLKMIENGEDLHAYSTKTKAQLEADFVEAWEAAHEGKTYAEVKELFPETCALLKTEKWRVRYDGGESYEEMHRRVTAAFAEIIAENEGKTVAVASHGGAIRMYLATALGIPLQSVEKAPTVSNASLTVVEIENGEARIALLGEDGFLAEERFAVDKELH